MLYRPAIGNCGTLRSENPPRHSGRGELFRRGMSPLGDGARAGKPRAITRAVLYWWLLVFIITTQLVRNSPAPLNWRYYSIRFNARYRLRHHDHHQISVYARGWSVSMIGIIEWSKLANGWYALGVGLGFGLQRNFR